MHINEFIRLLSVLDTMGESGRDCEGSAIRLSSLHKHCWWAGFMCLTQNTRGRAREMKIVQSSTDLS